MLLLYVNYYILNNFLYVYKAGKNNEIADSIRLARHFYPSKKIFVIGDKPKVEDVIHIPHKQVSFNRFTRVITMMIDAFSHMDSYILMNDDFFISDRFDLNTYHTCGELRFNPRKPLGYHECLKNTKQWLEYYNLPILKYDCHQPMMFEKEKFLPLLDKLIWKEQMVLIKSIYGNYYKLPNIQIENLKVRSHSEMLNKWQKYGAFSTADNMPKSMVDFIQALPDSQ